jgi:hypothetical protein
MKNTIMICDWCKKEILNGNLIFDVITKPNKLDVNEYDVCEKCIKMLDNALSSERRYTLLPLLKR